MGKIRSPRETIFNDKGDSGLRSRELEHLGVWGRGKGTSLRKETAKEQRSIQRYKNALSMAKGRREGAEKEEAWKGRSNVRKRKKRLLGLATWKSVVIQCTDGVDARLRA